MQNGGHSQWELTSINKALYIDARAIIGVDQDTVPGWKIWIGVRADQKGFAIEEIRGWLTAC